MQIYPFAHLMKNLDAHISYTNAESFEAHDQFSVVVVSFIKRFVLLTKSFFVV